MDKSNILLSYFETSKAYRVYNSRSLTVEEFIYVKFNDAKPNRKLSKLDEFFANLILEGTNELTSNKDKVDEADLEQYIEWAH